MKAPPIMGARHSQLGRIAVQAKSNVNGETSERFGRVMRNFSSTRISVMPLEDRDFSCTCARTIDWDAGVGAPKGTVDAVLERQ